MIRVFHESPKEMFEVSKQYNDYIYILQYCLNDPEYFKYVTDEIKSGKEVIFDNSAFEYGLNLPSDDVFATNIMRLSAYAPDKSKFYFIVNDYLDEKDRTIESMENWIKKYSNLGCKIIGSIQGKTMEELVECYKYMSENPMVDKIAITFDSKAYEDAFPEQLDKKIAWMMGRQTLVNYLIGTDIWNPTKPHHLLGCGYAEEFKRSLYQYVIDTIDTSSPIVCGIKGVVYQDYGNPEKPSIKLCDLLDAKLHSDQIELALYNVRKFRKLIHRNDF